MADSSALAFPDDQWRSGTGGGTIVGGDGNCIGGATIGGVCAGAGDAGGSVIDVGRIETGSGFAGACGFGFAATKGEVDAASNDIADNQIALLLFTIDLLISS